jgi:nitrogen fixation NifU-like protein
MSELAELYQQVILDHNRAPRNFRAIAGATCSAEGYNPLCGDHFTLALSMDGDRITDAAFQGTGCAISKASASMMTEAVRGLLRAEAEAILDAFHAMVTGRGGDPSALGKLAAFSGVSEFPARVKCATLAWHALRAALEGRGAAVSTE